MSLEELGAGLHNLYNLTEIPILLYPYIYIVKDPWILGLLQIVQTFLLILRFYYHPTVETINDHKESLRIFADCRFYDCIMTLENIAIVKIQLNP